MSYPIRVWSFHEAGPLLNILKVAYNLMVSVIGGMYHLFTLNCIYQSRRSWQAWLGLAWHSFLDLSCFWWFIYGILPGRKIKMPSFFICNHNYIFSRLKWFLWGEKGIENIRSQEKTQTEPECWSPNWGRSLESLATDESVNDPSFEVLNKST